MSIDINWSLLSEPDYPTAGPSNSNGGQSYQAASSSTDPNLTPPGSGIGSTSSPEDALASSLIQILNAQLSSAKRPSFIGPVTVTSFSFGANGPDLEIKDIRDVWRVLDEGDEEGDLEAEEAEARRLEEEAIEREKEELRSELDGERYELVSPISNDYPTAIGYGNRYDQGWSETEMYRGTGQNDMEMDMDVDDEVSHVEDNLTDVRYRRRSAGEGMISGRNRGRGLGGGRRGGPSNSGVYTRAHGHFNSMANVVAGSSTPARGIARSTSNPVAVGLVPTPGSRSFVPFHFDPNNEPSLAGGLSQSQSQSHLPSTPGLFSPRIGMGIGIGTGLGFGGSQVGLHTGETPSQRAGPTRSRAGSVASMPIPSSAAALNALHHQSQGGAYRSSISRAQSQARGGAGVYHRKASNEHGRAHIHANVQGNWTETRDTTQLSPPPSPPAHPSGLPRPSTTSSSIPSLQLHLHLSHASDLNLTLLTSLQVNYPSKLFMALPLKLSITGFQLEGEIVMAYSGDKHRVHLTILDDISNSSSNTASSSSNPHSQNTANNSTHPLSNLNPASSLSTATGPSEDRRNLPIGQRLLPSLQIESEIGHADAHVLRNVGKVERFIVDVIRKTLVEELVFPNFHTIAL
ncbi:mitochondrial distribution and morphology protein 12 [Kwoniella heveanensis BCC8398]|uniref:Mitochondrial distribution and morphology protein 12 n=1 Tax=Kwoniella heveanensis BCC8398 TaxID=1296120 RepID=A0A1B9GHL1_9TREE|nr:mitochondrial distribution and morphology protein 12 [Kwoniella heveanensis BCC8398]